jgi:hypothetical protein
MVDGVNAAHISVWAEAGLPSECPAFPERVPPIPEAVRTHDGYRITSHSEDAIAFLSCAPHRAPRSGATVPASQLDQLGSTVSMAASGEAEMSLPDQCMVVFGAVVFGGVATIGEPALIDPPRGWGNLHVQMRPEGVAMRWFWPQDLSCRKMRLQVRPDRYPRPNDDDDVSECHRSVYESAGQCLVSVPQHWNRAYVRVGRADSLAEQDAVFGKADRHDSVPGSRARTGSPFLVRFATA